MDRGTSVRRPVLLPYLLSNCARPHMKRLRNAPLPLHRIVRPHKGESSALPAGKQLAVRTKSGPSVRTARNTKRLAPTASLPIERIPIPRNGQTAFQRAGPTVPGQFETRPAKSAPVTVFALFGNMLSKNRSHYLQNIPYTIRNDYEVTISKKNGHNLLIRRITKKKRILPRKRRFTNY